MQTRNEHFEAEAEEINTHLNDIHFEVASLESDIFDLLASINSQNGTGGTITEDEAEHILSLAQNVEYIASEIQRLADGIIDCIRSRDEDEDEN